MPRLGRYARVLRARLWRPSVEEEVRLEFDHHLEMLEHEFRARGADAATARREAHAKFGDPQGVAEACHAIGRRRDREMRRSEWLHELAQDARYALRQLRLAPRFTLVAVLTLAIGLGATTTIFGIADAVLFRPLPAREPDRLAMVMATSPTGQAFTVSERDYLDWRDRARGLANVAAFAARTLTLRGDVGAEELVGAAATHTLFPTLGVAPLLGRTFVAEEDVPGGDVRVAVIAYALWQRRFGGDPALVSQTLELDGVRHRVVGVMPPGFDFPGRVEVWVPLAPSPTYHRGDRRLSVVARLAPSVTRAQAARELSAVARQLAAEYPASNAGWGAQLRPFAEWYVSPQLEARVAALLATVAVLLAMACVNVAGLLLARAATREREMALRSSLGAGRGRLVRQLLTESLVLSLLGAAVGVGAAAAAIPIIRGIGSAAVPRLQGLTLDWRVLTFALGACCTTGLLFGLAPARRLAVGAGARGAGLVGTLRSGSRAVGGRLRGTLVVASVGLAMLLLVGAGLVGGSFVRLMRAPLGFSPDGVLTGAVTVPNDAGAGPERAAAFYAALTRRLEEIPGVRAAGAINIAPLGGGSVAMEFAPAGAGPARAGEYRLASWRAVTPRLFAALDVPLLWGRLLDEGDRFGVPDVIVINETMARLGWPGADPVGRRVRLESGRTATVVGVVGDTRHLSPDSVPPPTMYFAHGQFAWRAMWLTVRTSGDPLIVAGAVRRELAALDPRATLTRVRPLAGLVHDRTAEPRLTVAVFAIFASTALVLAAVGLYGVVSYAVSQRTREIGVRLALGAPPRRVVAAVLGQGVRLAAAGVALGGVAAYGAAGALRSILFETEPTDATTFLAIGATLLAVAAAASAAPARRAARVDPVVALRCD